MNKGVKKKVNHVLRYLLPRRLISAIRLLIVFQFKHGHVNCKNGFPVNGNGEYQPWLTYPAIEFLNGLDFSNKRVFEFGAGSSTLYWAKRAKQVVSVEFNKVWFDALVDIKPENVQLLHEENGHTYADKILQYGKFDVVVVDGAERFLSAKNALSAVAEGGMIVFDNAEWYPNAVDFLSNSGMFEVRFSGFSPVNAFTSTTTVFLTKNFSIPRNPKARLPPLGGCSIEGGALDDA